MIWDWQYAWSTLPELLRGLLVTLGAVGGGTSIALVFGLVLAICRRSQHRWLSQATAGMVEAIRSTPLLVQIYFAYYSLPALGLKLTPLTVGTLSLGLHYACYMSEVYRAGIESVGQGQWSAASALHLNRFQTYRYVILPQAIAPIVPALGNYVIAMLKDAPLLSAITVLEILQRAKILGKQTFRYLEPLTIVGVIFLILSLGAALGVRALERKLKQTSS